MKKRIMIIMLLGLIVFSFVTKAYATSRFDDVCYKLGRGLTNIVTGVMEFGYAIDSEIRDGGVYKGLCFGAMKGIIRSVTRVGAGAYEVVTFLIEYPEDYQPLLEPEFVFAKDE
ncbi:MAG: exosortase system-associated protein, TIGR04073 family [Candidatus Omnitrophica bacterium]|nr:exosortase system-associated protein, TIGR04073 family [Candidatus Omnitrophota bacterium]